MVLNLLKDIKKIKITANPNSYATVLFGEAKIGKSTLIKHIYGDRVLFLETEARDRALVGANVAHVNSWVDFITALGQLKHSKELHKKFDVIAIDTVDNLVRFVEDYAKEHFDEKELGGADFGKDYVFAKDQWNRYVTSIHGLGFTPVYVCHDKFVPNRIPVEKISPEQISGNVQTVRDGQQVYYDFKTAIPDLPEKYWNPINKSVDQILHMGTIMTKDGKGMGHVQRVIHMRKSPQWLAGSTFPKIPSIIKADAGIYRQTLKDAVNYYDKKDQTKADYNKPVKSVDFKKLMKKAKDLGFKLAKSGKKVQLKRIVTDVFGPDGKLMEATPNQKQEVQVAIVKMKKLV